MEKNEDFKMSWDYLQKRPLSYSSLKEFRKSPRHYIYRMTKPYEPPTDAMKTGLLAEHFLLHEELGDKFYIVPPINRRTNAGKEEFQKHIEAAIGKTIVTQEQVTTAQAIAQNALKDPMIKLLVENKTIEQKKLYWNEKVEWNGKTFRIPMIGYVDFESVPHIGQTICEVKTDRNGDPEGFQRTISQNLYYLQGAIYSVGYMKTAFQFPGFKWIVLDTTEPYGAMTMDFSQRDMEQAKAEYFGLLVKFVQCMEENRWNEDYRFWLREDANSFTYFMPKWLKSPIMYFGDEG